MVKPEAPADCSRRRVSGGSIGSFRYTLRGRTTLLGGIGNASDASSHHPRVEPDRDRGRRRSQADEKPSVPVVFEDELWSTPRDRRLTALRIAADVERVRGVRD